MEEDVAVVNEATHPQRDYVGYGANPPRVQWPNGAKLALNIVVNYEEGSEYTMRRDNRNEGLGEVPYAMDPRYRDMCVESVYEYGSRAGIWRLLRLFKEYGVSSTFFACAEALERNPQVAERMMSDGHDFVSHGWRWTEFWLLSRDEEREHIGRAIETFEKVCGQRPIGWYCRYGPSENTRELVVEEGNFLYDCDAYNDDLPYFVQVNGTRHLVVPYSLTYNDMRFVMPFGGEDPGAFADALIRGIDELRAEGAAGHPKMMSIGLHPRIAGQAHRVSALRQIVEHALDAGDVWFARRNDIAQWWLDHHAEFSAGDSDRRR